MARQNTSVPVLYNREAERAVLGACLLGRLDLVTRTRAALPPDPFYVARHAMIWRAICSLADQGIAADPLTVTIRLKEAGERWDAETGLYLHELYDAAPLVHNPAHTAEITRWARLRLVWEAGTRMTQLAAGIADQGAPDDRLNQLVTQTQSDLAEIGAGGGSGAALTRLRAELLDTKGLDTITEPQPLIEGLLYMNSLIWLQGKPGAAKSFLVLDWAGCVGTGQRWQGYAAHHGVVLYLIAEGVTGIKQRVRAWEASAGHAMDDVYFLPVAVQAGDEQRWAALCDLAAELRPALIVLDTQARITVGMEENSSQDMGVFVDRIEQLRQAGGGPAIVVVHHQGRDGEHLRGSSALDGAAETVVRVRKEDERVTVECVKQKNAVDFDPVDLRLIRWDFSAVLGLREPGSTVHIGSAAVKRMVSAWWSTDETEWVSFSHVIEAGHASKGTWSRAINPLVKAGVIEKEPDAKRPRYRLTHAAPALIGLTVPSPVPPSHETQAIDTGIGLTVSPPLRGETGETNALWPETEKEPRPFTQHDRPPDAICDVCGLPLDGFYAAQGNTRHTGCELRP
jgi:hypothetical protein